jgi:hypothetical protein
LTQLGLAIPSAIPTFYPQVYANRYLALLVSVKFAVGETARLVGMRQRVLLGTSLPPGGESSNPNYPIFFPQVTPEWHFQDGNISWHLRRVPLQGVYNSNEFDGAESSFRVSDTPCILFENAPAQLGGYAPPNGGVPPNDVLLPEFGDFHDLRFPWVNDHAWDSLDIEVQGPCAINLYASIKQTNPSTRLTIPSGTCACPLPPEEQFIQQFPTAIYTRIAGSLIFERANLYAEAKQIEPNNNPAFPPSVIKTRRNDE